MTSYCVVDSGWYGSSNSLLPEGTITWAKADLLSIRFFRRNFSDIKKQNENIILMKKNANKIKCATLSYLFKQLDATS